MYVLHVVHWNIPKSISELAKYTQLTNHRTQSWCHFMVSKHSLIMYSAHLTLKTTVSVSNKSFICYDKLLEIIYGITAVKKVERFIASITTSPIGQAVILIIMYIKAFKTDFIVSSPGHRPCELLSWVSVRRPSVR